jgi:site-specific recombinase XerD
VSSPTLSDAVDDFLLARRADGLAEATLTWYASLLGAMTRHLGAQPINEVSTSALRRYIVELRQSDYAPDSIYAHVKALHIFFRWCADEYSIANPARHIAFPKQPPSKLPRRAQDSDIIKMFSVCGDDDQGIRDRAILGFLTDTGCRAGGLVSLTVDNLDIAHRRAYVCEKGTKTRPVFFSPETAGLLKSWLAVRDTSLDFVFYNLRRRQPLTPNGLLQILRRLGRTAGATGPIHPHAFRHRMGEKLMERGVNSGVLQQIMGHASVETTIKRYGQLADNQLAAQHRKVKSVFKKPKTE